VGTSERMSTEKVNDMWRSGYCPIMIEYAKTTDAGPTGSISRIAYLEVHIKSCPDCYHATVMKNVEANAAELMGPVAFAAFQSGQSVVQRPGFEDAMRKAVQGLLRSQHATDQFFAWWRRIISRTDYEKEAPRGKETN